MILVDANVPMYAAGARHSFKSRSVDFMDRVADGDVEAVVDAEVLEEILLDRHAELTARDALHASVVFVNGLEGICSFDRDFDVVPGLRRTEPEAL